MEWGTFITVIAAVYLAWYGFNFLFDLLIAGKPKVETESGITYNMGDFMAEEEKPRVVSPDDFGPSKVEVYKTEGPATNAPVASDTPADGGSGQNIKTPPAPAPVESARQEQSEDSDWAEAIDQEGAQQVSQEETIDIPVQGQPMSVSEYIQSLKDEAKSETASITF